MPPKNPLARRRSRRANDKFNISTFLRSISSKKYLIIVSMKFPTVNFKEANQNLILIIAIGVALGVANYALGVWPTLGQSLVQQVSISLVIGYTLILIAANSLEWFTDSTSDFKKYILLIVLFGLVGIVGSEIDGIVRTYAFQQATYTFLQLNGLHLLFDWSFACFLN